MGLDWIASEENAMNSSLLSSPLILDMYVREGMRMREKVRTLSFLEDEINPESLDWESEMRKRKVVLRMKLIQDGLFTRAPLVN